MRRFPAFAAAIVLVLAAAAARGPAFRAGSPAPRIQAPDDGLALTPPMGWYPWNTFGEEPQNERLIKEIVDALVARGLKEAGYQYVGPDEGICFYRDVSGRLEDNLARYPGGLRALGDYIHLRGLKYALYTDAGTRTCSRAMPGTKGREAEDMRRFAEWRADYIKIDWCNTEGQDIVKTYGLLREAQQAAGRAVVHSLCSWGEGEPWRWAAGIGHLWRTTPDICAPGKADWGRAMKMALANETLHSWAGPGTWNDPDMMIAGMPGMSATRDRAFFSLWCMMAAPLIAGNDLRDMSEATARVLTNLEAIGIDQDPLGVQGRIVRRDGQVSVWAGKPLFDGSRAVLVFNEGERPAEARLEWREAGFDPGARIYIRDLWARATSGPRQGGLTLTVAPGDVAFLRLSRAAEFPIPPVLVADTYLVSLRAAGTSSERPTGTVTVVNKGSLELPPWRVRSDLPPWLSVEVTKNGRSQTFLNRASTAGLAKGSYHAVVRADTMEPLSGRPVSSLYYDVDLEVGSGPERDARR